MGLRDQQRLCISRIFDIGDIARAPCSSDPWLSATPSSTSGEEPGILKSMKSDGLAGVYTAPYS
ncbi:hypothetical protein [Terriglobus aquaticus]|uniref:hypothetical protein n=1 Tax=Terriglobus aquaticus TaxID=940139 RepID=UPI0031DF73BB